MRVPSSVLVCSAVVVVSLAACKQAPPEPEPKPAPAASQKEQLAASPQPARAEGGKGADPRGKGADPHRGSFSLAEATKELEGAGPIVATIATNKGSLQCRLFDDKAPLTVANFIGLATGKRAWRDPSSGAWVTRPAYDGTTFHRIIKGFMIQGGDPKGDGGGEPGYVIKDEIWAGAKHDKAGLLCMANRGPNTNGAQFFITDAPAAHLDGGYTIFGECAPESIVHAIAGVAVGAGDRPREPVTIERVTISRDEKK